MERFFIKKSCFAVVFLIFILGFSAVNFGVNRDVLAGLAHDLTEIDGISGLKSWTKDVEAQLSEEILGRMNYVELYGYTQKILGKHEFNNFSYIQDYDRMLYYGSVSELPTDDLEEYVKNVKRLSEYVESRGGNFLVLLPPSKVLAGISTVNSAWPLNDPNNRIDKIMNLFQQYGIEAVDLRIAMQNSGRSLDQLFFKTDHHWTPLAAFYGTKDLINQISDRFGEQLDPDNYYRNLDNYHTYTYHDCFLGSSGRNTGILYSGLEDYTMLWPECEMEFSWTDYEHGKEKRGSYTQALLQKSALEDIKNVYKSSTNKIYLNEVVNRDKIVNHSKPDGPRMTVLRDSYFSPMACFLAPMCSEINMLWTKSGENMEQFIRESEFDYVILEIYPYNLDEESFNFFHGTSGQKGA